jgi:fatty acid kinase fatty acid binding subunit
MPGVRFVCDSTCDLPAAYVREHRLTIVPLKVVFGDEALVDGVDIDAEGFYARMRRESRNPTTSQPTPAEFEAAFRTAGADGDSVVCTCMSSEMSGTWQSAMSAREAVAGDVDVHVIDTRTVSIGHNNILTDAIPRGEGGASAEEVVDHIHDLMRRQRSVFTVTTLEYLKRGGRIGGARALLGSVLDIKPVLQVSDGKIERYKQVRTTSKAVEMIAQELISAVGESGRKARCVVGQGDRLDDQRRLADMVAPHCDGTPDLITIGPIVGAHAGPGLLGMSFFLV